jgi:hypothetical protein
MLDAASSQNQSLSSVKFDMYRFSRTLPIKFVHLVLIMMWKPLRGRSFVSSGKTRAAYLALVRNVALPLFSRFLPNPVNVDGFDLYFPDHGRVSA